MPSRIALFGATGNVGKELIVALKEQLKTEDEYKFLLFTRDASKAEDPGDERFECLTLPVKEEDGSSDTAALAELLKDVETCFCCIPQLQVHKAKDYVDALIPAWTEAGVKRIVKVGTGNAAQYEYGRRHQAAEEAIRVSKLALAVVEGGEYSTNPTWLGPGPPGAPYALIDVFKGMSYMGGMFRSMGNVGSFYGDTIQQPFMDLKDFGHALASCLLNASKHEGKTYKVYSEAVSMSDVANVYSELLGRKISVIDLSQDEIRALLQMDKSLNEELIDILLEMFAQMRKGVYEPDSSWDGLSQLCPDRKPGTFRELAEAKVNAGWKPIRLWK